MNRRIVMLAVFVPAAALIGLLAWALIKSGGTPGGLGINNVFGGVAINEGPAPSFQVELFSGEPLALEDLRGKVVMVDFWSSWCPPCIAEAPTLSAVYSEYRDRGVEFLGVAIWDDPGAIQDHIRRFAVPYPNTSDDRGKMAVDYGLRGIPEKFFIAPDGNLVRKYIGPATEPRLKAILDELLAQPAA